MIATLMLIPLLLGYGAAQPWQSLPAELQGWMYDGHEKVYDRKTIFNYIDGGGEVYLAYGFTEVLVRTYEKKGQPSIEIAIFDMGDSRDAYGIFSYELEEENAEVGQGAEYNGGMLRFWQDRYFVCVMTQKDTETAKKAGMAFGEAIAGLIKARGELPEALDYVPKDDISSCRYFHTFDCLNRLYYISNQNILSLDRDTEAVLARYGKRNPPCYLLIAHYRDEKAAESAWHTFIRAYLPEGTAGKPVKTENGCWTGGEPVGSWIVTVFDAPSSEEAKRLIEAVIRKGLIHEGRSSHYAP